MFVPCQCFGVTNRHADSSCFFSFLLLLFLFCPSFKNASSGTSCCIQVHIRNSVVCFTLPGKQGKFGMETIGMSSGVLEYCDWEWRHVAWSTAVVLSVQWGLVFVGLMGLHPLIDPENTICGQQKFDDVHQDKFIFTNDHSFKHECWWVWRLSPVGTTILT